MRRLRPHRHFEAFGHGEDVERHERRRFGADRGLRRGTRQRRSRTRAARNWTRGASCCHLEGIRRDVGVDERLLAFLAGLRVAVLHAEHAVVTLARGCAGTGCGSSSRRCPAPCGPGCRRSGSTRSRSRRDRCARRCRPRCAACGTCRRGSCRPDYLPRGRWCTPGPRCAGTGPGCRDSGSSTIVRL